MGEIPLRIPKLREGTYYPSLLEPRKRSEQALLAVIQEAAGRAVSQSTPENHRVVSMALVIAVGVSEEGERTLLGFDVGASEEEAFWKDFLRGLKGCGLKGVQLVISDAHEGRRMF